MKKQLTQSSFFSLVFLSLFLLNFSFSFGQDLKSSLIFQYSFENDLQDNSGNGNTASSEGTISYADGKYGSAVVLDTSLSFLLTPGSLFTAGNNYTLSFWVYFDPANISAAIPSPTILHQIGGRAVVGLGYPFVDQPFSFMSYFGGVPQFTFVVPETEIWMHVGLVIDATNASTIWYFDGIKDTTISNVTLDLTDGGLKVGGHKNPGRYQNDFIGMVDELMLFNKILSDEEVVLAMNNFEASGISDRKGAKEISLYPNPVENTLYLNNLSDVKNVSIHSITGKMIQRMSVTRPDIQVDTKSLTPGMYFIRIEQSNGETSVSKFLKR